MKSEIAARLHINEVLTQSILVAFLREEVLKTGHERVIFGLSGGIDSALVAYLAVEALGKENVHAVMMPYKTSSPDSLAHAQRVADALCIKTSTLPITGAIDAYFAQADSALGESASVLRRGNRMARERMATLFDLSAHDQALVLGTSNKTELLLGYGTQFGDLASALNPVGDLYKTQIRQLSAAIGVPTEILTKAPSADLWEEQTDEKELGFTYDEADEILYQLVDLRLSAQDLAQAGYNPALLAQIERRIRLNHYKRKPPIIAKVSTRTVGVDFHYLRDWGV